MDASKSLIRLVFVMIMVSSISTSESYVFSVGDRSGWVENPPVPYNNWAGSKRFLINDTVVFNYKSQDSVLVVTKESYDSCNLSSPIQTLSGGNSAYKLDHSGPHYFISGAAGHCGKGQKMIVVVLSIRNKPVPSPPATPTPSTPSPAPTPSTPTPLTPSPSSTPFTPTPSTPSPSPTPSSTPTISAPSSSPTPSTTSPSTPPPSPTPSITPTISTPSSSPTPSTTTPSKPSPSSTPSTPAPSTPVSPPPPKTSSSSSVSRVSGVSMGLVALVLGAVLN